MARLLNPREIKPGDAMLFYFGQAEPGAEAMQLLLAQGDPKDVAAIAASLPEIAVLRIGGKDVPMKRVTRIR